MKNVDFPPWKCKGYASTSNRFICKRNNQYLFLYIYNIIFNINRKLKSIQCNYCDYQSSAQKFISSHIKRRHKDIVQFPSKTKKHLRKKDDQGRYVRVNHKCPHCKYSSNRKDALDRHVLAVHDKTLDFICEECGKAFANVYRLQYHSKTVHKGIKDFQCHMCEHNASTNHKIQLHVKLVHLKERPFSCHLEKCSFTAGTQRSLKIHIESVHYGVKNVSCPYCEYKTYQFSILRGHVKRKHADIDSYNIASGHNIEMVRIKREGPIFCFLAENVSMKTEQSKPKCVRYNCDNYPGVDRKTSLALTEDIKAEEDPKPDDTHESNFQPSFEMNHNSSESLLKIDESHISQGEEVIKDVPVSKQGKTVKQFLCDKCEFMTTTKANLKRHNLVVHEKIKKFVCDQCGLRFGTRANLTHHVDCIHRGLKKYSCPQCDHTAATRHKIKLHILHVHEKVRPYKCDICSFSAAEKKALQIHIDAVHLKLKNISCPKCEYKTHRRGFLNLHMKRRHADLTNGS